MDRLAWRKSSDVLEEESQEEEARSWRARCAELGSLCLENRFSVGQVRPSKQQHKASGAVRQTLVPVLASPLESR